MNIAQIVWNSRSSFASKPILIVDGKGVNFDDFADQVQRLTGALRSQGIRPGDRVVLAMNNCTEWLVSILAVLGSGAICVPTNPGLRPPEMCSIANHCEPKLAILDAELVGHFAEAKVKFDTLVRNGGGQNDWLTVVSSVQPDKFVADVIDNDPALIFYTSGTTGVPKGVLLGHHAEIFAAQMVAKHVGITSSDCSIVMGSLAFIYPLIINALASISGGATVILQDRFHPQMVAEAVRKHRVTIMMGVPTMYVMLMNYVDAGNASDFSSIRVAFSGGASLPDALVKRGKASLGFNIFDLWGMTECTPVTTFDPKRETAGQPDSCGRALPECAFKIVDDDLKECPIGTVGEVMLTGPLIMTGYYKNPTATAESMIDGWIRSGDLGKTDTNGFLYIVGRKKDLIIRGGANVYPVDVEEALYTHDGVAECAVIGKPDDVFGETVKAFVIRRTSAIGAAELIQHCKGKLADYKVPSEIEFIDELPKGPTGKILRRELRERSVNQQPSSSRYCGITMGPLSKLKVVELAGIGAGPHCAMMLADMGADVVRVDRPSASGLGVPIDPKFDLILRGRRSLAIDLKNEAGRETVLHMIDQADALIESFRPGVLERMGLGPEVCLKRNPKLVYARLTGWGQSGPYAQMAGHDINYIALSGVLHAIGPRNGAPIPPLNLVGDFGGGAVYCAFGIVSALLHAQRTGQGQVVDAAMVDGAAALLTMIVGFQRGGIWSSQRGANIVDGGAPYYAVYETSDGRFVSIGAMEEKFYELLLLKLGLKDDGDMRPHTDRSKWDYQREQFRACFLTRSRDQWCELLEGTDTCFAPVLTIDEASSHPHLKTRQTYIDLHGVNQPAPNPRFSHTPSVSTAPPASLGQHSCEILTDWGISAEMVEELCKNNIVFQAGQSTQSQR